MMIRLCNREKNVHILNEQINIMVVPNSHIFMNIHEYIHIHIHIHLGNPDHIHIHIHIHLGNSLIFIFIFIFT